MPPVRVVILKLPHLIGGFGSRKWKEVRSQIPKHKLRLLPQCVQCVVCTSSVLYSQELSFLFLSSIYFCLLTATSSKVVLFKPCHPHFKSQVYEYSSLANKSSYIKTTGLSIKKNNTSVPDLADSMVGYYMHVCAQTQWINTTHVLWILPSQQEQPLPSQK